MDCKPCTRQTQKPHENETSTQGGLLECYNYDPPGLSANLQEIDDAQKTAVINSELLRLSVDIATLQQTPLAEFGTLRERAYTIIWRGKAADETREHGVGSPSETPCCR